MKLSNYIKAIQETVSNIDADKVESQVNELTSKAKAKATKVYSKIKDALK